LSKIILPTNISRDFDKFGAEGWELATTVRHGDTEIAIFKRRVTP